MITAIILNVVLNPYYRYTRALQRYDNKVCYQVSADLKEWYDYLPSEQILKKYADSIYRLSLSWDLETYQSLINPPADCWQNSPNQTTEGK